MLKFKIGDIIGFNTGHPFRFKVIDIHYSIGEIRSIKILDLDGAFGGQSFSGMNPVAFHLLNNPRNICRRQLPDWF